MAEENRTGKASQIIDVAGGLAAAGAIAVGAGAAVNGINKLETLPPKPTVVTAVVEESPAEQQRNKAWKEIVAGGATVVVGAGAVGAILASRREQNVAPTITPTAWGADLTAEAVVEPAPQKRAPAPQHQGKFSARVGTAEERDAAASQSQQQQQ